ncbi:hypothetical protein JCM8208_007660 [Rhodotorula glutinis]
MGEVDEWAWRRSRRVGLFSWELFRHYLFKIRRAFDIPELKVYTPSTWLPDDAPPIKMVERRARSGKWYLSITHVHLAQIEDHLVKSGRASASQMAMMSRESGLKHPTSARGRLVLVTDETFSDLLEDQHRRNGYKPATSGSEPSTPVVEPGTDLSPKNPSSTTAPSPASSSSSARSSTSSGSPSAISTRPVLDERLLDDDPDNLADGLPDKLDDKTAAVDPPVASRALEVATRFPPLKYHEVVKEASRVASRHFDLEAMRFAYAHAKQHGSAAFLAIDLEWRAAKRATHLTAVGWSSLEFIVDPETGEIEERRDGLHAVVRENMRQDKLSAEEDAKFTFGRTVALPQRALYHTLYAVLYTLAYQKQLFLIFHDPRGDLRALDQLGFDTTRDFHTNLRMLEPVRGTERVARVVDTQRLFSAWVGRAPRVGLEAACAELQVCTDRKLLHHAGNDAHYTLALFERLMDRALRPDPTSSLVADLAGRPTAASLEELHLSFVTSEQQDVEDEEEQEAQDRDDDEEKEDDDGPSAPLCAVSGSLG